MQPVGIQTRFAKDVNPDNVLPDYPRPQMVRSEWQNLNGLWEYAIMPKGPAMPSEFDGQILVPFPLESALSGVKKALLPNQLLWYKRSIAKPDVKGGKRVMIHFGAVDYQATVFINGKEIGGHTGGYQNFSFDITDALKAGNNELLVKVWDPTDQGANPHGKQVLQPQNIMYTATSGIWQTVWMETVPAAHISNLVMTPSLDSNHLRLAVNTAANAKDYTIEAIASNGSTVKGKPGAQLLLPVKNAHLWSPEDPYLYNLNVRLLYKGKVIDTVGSYFGMRKIEVKNDDKGVARLFLNNKYTYHLGVLDQGFWPEGLYTAPTDESLKFDILAIKNMGYNTIRKHIKLEPARWYYHADRIGMLVWQDMVTCAGDSPEAHEQFEKENKENIAQLHNYPSIVLWILFNEGWARYDQQRLTEWMKKADPSRVVNGHTGENYDRGSPQNPMDKWASSDMTDIHDYPGPGIAPSLPGKARVLGEWGGVRVVTPKHQWNGAEGWGYIQVTPAEFAQKYEFMIKHLKIFEEEGLSGSIYTEPFDVETEENGMMSYDREVIKIPAEKLRQIHASLVPAAESYAWSDFKALLSDTTNPNQPYTKLLQQFKDGKRDKSFLYELGMMASQLNDTNNINLISNAYINLIKKPYTIDDIYFIRHFAKNNRDVAFNFIIKNADAINVFPDIGEPTLNIARNIITNEIWPLISSRDEIEPNFIELQKEVIHNYGKIGEGVYLKNIALYYYQKKDYKNWINVKLKIHEKYPSITSVFDMNNDAWFAFENIKEKEFLEIALGWSEKVINQEPTSNYYDTYANLLYKLGRIEEAIKMEKKGMTYDIGNGFSEDVISNLKKMEKGIPTWSVPVNDGN